MKKLGILALCAILLFASLTACTNTKSEGSAIIASHFSGKITEVRDSAYLLEVTDVGNGQFGMGNPVIVLVYETPTYQVGDVLTVEFDGTIAKSYPPQITNATAIHKIS